MNASLLIILPVEFNPPVIYISSGVTPTTDDQLFIYYNYYNLQYINTLGLWCTEGYKIFSTGSYDKIIPWFWIPNIYVI